MMFLIGDFETASEAELSDVGLYNYATHHTTRVLMFSYGLVQTLSEKPVVKRWEPRDGQIQMPVDLRQALDNPTVTIIAFNSAFERNIFKHVLGITIPIERFQDPQASARYLSLPANLEDVGMVLGLPYELRKDKRGNDALDLFSFPKKHKKKEGGGTYFNDWNSHPEDWKILGEYCDQDVRAELEVARREALLEAFPLPDRERRVWIFDQTVNDRGMPTDRQFVQNLFTISQKNKDEKLAEQNRLTGLENANSQAQLLPWARKRGYPLTNLRKGKIEILLKDTTNELTAECREVLKARMEASSTSYKKLETMSDNLCPDNRIRNMFIYMGSARCGRWSGAAVQPHNFARPDGTFEKMNNVIKARNFIYALDYEGLKTAFKNKNNEYYSPLIVAKNIIRTVFVAPSDKRFNVCDLNAIETRVGAWVAQCQSLLDVFEPFTDEFGKFYPNGKDPYLDFASKMYGIPYIKLWADYKGFNGETAQIEAKRKRQIAKPGVLGAIYRLGGGGWGRDKNGDEIKTGLWGYAEAMGVDMEREQAHEVVKIFREAYSEIGGAPNSDIGFGGGIWYVLENAVKDVLQGERTIRKAGPNGCIVIDKVTIEGRDPMLRIKLPSGRYLHYLDASIQDVRMPWRQKKDVPVEFDVITGEATKYEQQDVDVYKPGFTYYGKDQHTDQWTMIISHGGKIFENIVQAIARDVLADKLLEFEKIGLETVGHVHDEGICLSDDDPFAPGVLEMEKIMNTPVSWAPTLPLGSDGFEDYVYHK
jgi:DNA polymerase